MIIEHAHGAVFADAPQKGMLMINPRIVNSSLYKEEMQAMESWHEEQSRAEKPFFS